MKPILFNTEMVRAILDGRKTVTRRTIKPQPTEHLTCGNNWKDLIIAGAAPHQRGDVLWVRETWCQFPVGQYHYKADYRTNIDQAFHQLTGFKWRPSIHMPREAARLFLRVTSVRVERLQDISPEQCEKEGMTEKQKLVLDKEEYWYWFRELWDSTIKKSDLPLYGWDANPWVWVIEFERIDNPA